MLCRLHSESKVFLHSGNMLTVEISSREHSFITVFAVSLQPFAEYEFCQLCVHPRNRFETLGHVFLLVEELKRSKQVISTRHMRFPEHRPRHFLGVLALFL
jgi:hypothetical protein